MTTFNSVQGIIVRAAAVGLLMSAASCGSSASEGASARRRASQLDSNDPAASVATNEVTPQRAGRDLGSVARGAARGPQDPTGSRPSTKEACDACQGLWAAHGIEAEEVCICKTSDEGRECIDGTDCQGECLLDGDAEFHVMEQGNPPRGYYRGRCAGYDTTFGCFRHIADDVQGQIPLTADEAGESICVD